jgi:hypothetical protein
MLVLLDAVEKPIQAFFDSAVGNALCGVLRHRGEKGFDRESGLLHGGFQISDFRFQIWGRIVKLVRDLISEI